MSAKNVTLPRPSENPNSLLDIEASAASDLRTAIGRLVRRLRVQYRFPLSQAAVLGRLDREGAQCIGELANAERVRPQSMGQTLTELEVESLIARRPDPSDRRRTKIELTEAGREALREDRAQRDDWLGEAMCTLTAEEQHILVQAAALMMRLSDL